MRELHNYHIYITTNFNKTVIYVGVTNHLARRLVEHFALRGTNYSFAGKYYAYNLIYYENFKYKAQAYAREEELKKWRRELKEQLIARKNPNWLFFNKKFCKEWPPNKLWGNYAESFLLRKKKEFEGKTLSSTPPLNAIVIYEDMDFSKIPSSHFLKSQLPFNQQDSSNFDAVSPHQNLQSIETPSLTTSNAGLFSDFDKSFQNYMANQSHAEVASSFSLSEREKGLINLALLIALEQKEELEMQIKTLAKSDVGAESIRDVILHTGIYVGLPISKRAIKIAEQVFEQLKLKE